MPHSIYVVTNLVNGKLYVGQTRTPYKRWREHLRKGRDTSKTAAKGVLHLAIAKYGSDQFTFDVLCQVETLHEANVIEIDLVARLDTQNINIGYNRTSGGQVTPPTDQARANIRRSKLGLKVSRATRLKMSRARKGFKQSVLTREKIRLARTGALNHNFGKKASAATRQKISAAGKGRRHTIAWREAMSAARSGARHPLWGKKHSLETRAKMSLAGKGRKQSPEHKAKRSAAMRATLARKKLAILRGE